MRVLGGVVFYRRVLFIEERLKILVFSATEDTLKVFLEIKDHDISRFQLIKELVLGLFVLYVGFRDPCLCMCKDCNRACANSLSSLKLRLKREQVECAVRRITVVQQLAFIILSGQTLVDIQAIVEISLNVCGNEADVVSKVIQMIIVLIEIRALTVCLIVLVIAYLGILILCAEGLVARKCQDNLAFVDVGIKLEVFTQLNVKAIIANQGLEQVKRNALHVFKVQTESCVYLKVNVFFFELKVDYVDVKCFATGQLICRIGLGKRVVRNRQDGFNGNVGLQVANRQLEGACSTVNDLLGFNDPAVLYKRILRIAVYLIPEAKYRDRKILINVDLMVLGVAVIGICTDLNDVSVLCLVDIGSLAVDILANLIDLNLNAEYVGFLGNGQVRDQHVGVKDHIVIIRIVAFLVRIDMNVIDQLRLIHLGREGDSAVFVGVEIELVGNNDIGVGLLIVCGNNYVSTFDCNVIGILDVDQIIVGLNGTVGNVGDGVIRKNFALTPFDLLVVCECVCLPVAVLILVLEVSDQAVVRVVIDLFCHDRYVLGNVVYGLQIGTVTECARTDRDLTRSIDHHLLDAGVSVERGVIDLGHGFGNCVIDSLNTCRVAIQRVIVLGVERAVAVVCKMRVLLSDNDLFQRNAVNKQIVAVKTCAGVLGSAVIACTQRDLFKALAVCKCLAANQNGVIVQYDLTYVRCTPECLGSDLVRNDHAIRGHIVSKAAIHDRLRSRELQQRCAAFGDLKQRTIAVGYVVAKQVFTQRRTGCGIIIEAERGDAGTSAKCVFSDRDNGVIEIDVAREIRVIECASPNGGKRIGKRKFGNSGIFKCRITDVVYLIALDLDKIRTVVECVRAEYVCICRVGIIRVLGAKINRGQILVACKCVVLNDRYLDGEVRRHFVFAIFFIAYSFFSFGILDQTREDGHVIFGNQRIAEQYAIHRFINSVFSCCDAFQLIGVSEGAVPNCGILCSLAFTDKSVKRNALNCLVAVECVSVKANNGIYVTVIGNKIVDRDLFCSCATGIDCAFLVC